ncbi:MAG: DNA/RNA non-specific endonuclease [Muribaculaceae bacterium]|nr:DNA/RNA non-specific endonuclease [Muribaculaceae bacterium]
MKKIILIICFVAIIGGIFLLLADRNRQAHTHGNSTISNGKVDSGAPHFPDLEIVSIPENTPSYLKHYTGFSLSFNPENKTPNWVGWELLGSETDGAESRSNLFWQDTEVRNCPTSDDYKRSGFDRGHLCPAADQKWSSEAMTDCFVMTNMAPQDHALNAGAWQTLEKRQRAWAKRDSAIVIVAGPIYEKSDKKRIGANKVRVPGAFFKVMVAPYLSSPRGIAFVYPNMSAPGNMQQYVMTIDEVERITGFDFFANLPDEIENKIESETSFKEWNKR